MGVWEQLNHAHESGIVHCDVRRGNVLRFEGNPVVIDWGFVFDSGTQEEYCGTVTTASNSILQTLKLIGTERISRLSIHDAISLLKQIALSEAENILKDKIV